MKIKLHKRNKFISMPLIFYDFSDIRNSSQYPMPTNCYKLLFALFGAQTYSADIAYGSFWYSFTFFILTAFNKWQSLWEMMDWWLSWVDMDKVHTSVSSGLQWSISSTYKPLKTPEHLHHDENPSLALGLDYFTPFHHAVASKTDTSKSLCYQI